MAAHQEDGVTMADIVRETEEQKQAGRIKYLVVAEERDIYTQQTRGNVGTRRDRGATNPRHDPDPSPSPGPNPDPVDPTRIPTQALTLTFTLMVGST